MNVKPTGKRVLVESLPQPETTPGGIHIPQGVAERSNEARVIAVGDSRIDATKSLPGADIQPGDRVIVSQYSGSEIEIDGRKMRIVEIDNILGIIRPDGPDIAENSQPPE